jgi:glycosyltransferase involved in cell wall biosynthesis
MRVVHIITRLILGGAQENTLLTVEEQHRAYRDDVTLITGPAIGPEGSLLDRARQGGFRLIVIDEMRRSLHPWKDYAIYRRLVRELKTLRPELVHTHSSKAGIIGRAAAQAAGFPAVHTVHGASFHYGQNPLAYRAYIAAERWAARRTRHFICVADAMTDDYVAAKIAERERFTTVYSGFDVDAFLASQGDPAELRRQWGFSDEHVVVGMIGRLFPLKGQEFLVAAAPEIVAAAPNVRFVLIGDGILRRKFEHEIDAAGLKDHFHFTGLLPPDAIPACIKAMDILVHTSQWEGLARVLPQALISGKPVVSFDVGGAREVCIPGETGYLVPRDDTSGVAQAVMALARDPEQRTRFGEAGRHRFQKQFRYQEMTRRIREVYTRVLDGPE